METAVAAPPRLMWPNLRCLRRRHPELGAAVVVLGAWVALVAGAAPAHAAHRGAHGAWSAAAGGLSQWILMTIAMMGPAALAGVRHTAVNSLGWRRGRAMAEFSAAYLAIWGLFGFAALATTARLPVVAGWTATALALAAAAAWQLTPVKRRWLRDCHRSVPLPPQGWRAEAGAVWFGLRNGCACLGSCWCLMLVMMVVPGAHLLWTAALTGIVTTERMLARPRRVTRLAALALGVAATGALIGVW
jgi:predicted metal-binding membrane protein